MMRSIYPVLAATLLLAGCAHVKFADGQRVAIEHDNSRAPEAVAALQAQADQACLASGGKVPAKLVSNLPVHNAAPAWMLRHTATFACAS